MDRRSLLKRVAAVLSAPIVGEVKEVEKSPETPSADIIDISAYHPSGRCFYGEFYRTDPFLDYLSEHAQNSYTK